MKELLMNEVILNRIIDLIFLFISLILGYITGRIQERLKTTRSINEMRYQKLYWRFQHLYLSKTKGAFLFSELEPALQEEFYDLLIDGYCYADNKLKLKITEFRWQILCNDTESLNSTFKIIGDCIFQDAEKLSNKLYKLKFKVK